MFNKILIANRGEIAVRIIHTCKDMGIKTVAVYSDVDATSLHVLNADESICIGPSEPTKSYLNIETIIDAAQKSNAEAIHPGYGFLSENSAFAAACEKNGIVFIGPPSDVIQNLGDKLTARNMMINGGVPVIPGLSQAIVDVSLVKAEAEKLGYPVLIKASAGGGGKGIRVVHSPDELADACAAASREALNAFNRSDIYLEKFFNNARHIEFQILADSFGHTIHILERECSIQRRHQKIIEETPSTALTPQLREKMGQAAVAAARASMYVNAGTVEFLLDENNQFYFLEINTRLQVEHPVTEMVTGIDLVRKQIEIASGHPLQLAQKDIQSRGHAIECRIYAEDPYANFLPSPGKIDYFKQPSGPGIRNDTGVYTGFEVPVDYDPILSKLIVYSETRKQAIGRMINALKNYIILGVKTPIPFLIDILQSKPFIDGDIFTHFIPTHFPDPAPILSDPEIACLASIAHEYCHRKTAYSVKTETSPTPWQTLGNWRQ
ncbi:MAG: acetyl-CoA carboxylase biotin carboxylase subunit [Candidatus Magnetomorum sp.]|nr:acetyl-CoA carboxylase biotin carboxylase subunit [Candidatus Magnetomorum sp.]